MDIPKQSSDRPNYFQKYYRQMIMTFLAILIVGVSIIYFSLSFTKPIMGLVLVLQDSTWVVESVDPNNTADLSGIKPGDIPIEINDQPAEDFLSRYTSHGRVVGLLVTEITVRDESGQTKQASLQNSKPNRPTQIELLVLFITAVLFWVIGLFVFTRQPKKKAAWILCLASLCFGLLLGSNVAGERQIPGAPQISVIAQILGPWLLLHFFIILPEERAIVQNSPWLYTLYIPPAVIIALFLLVGYADGQPLPWFRQIRLVEYGIVLIGVSVTTVFNFTRAPSTRTRQQMKIIAVCCLAALIPFIIIYLIPQLTLQRNVIPTGYIIFFISFIPLGMGYAVITQKLMDIDVIIRRGVVYGLISIIMALIMAAGILPGLSFGAHNSWMQIFIALALGVIATILVGPIKKTIEKMVDRAFYKDRYDYRQIIQSLSLSLNNYQELSEISRIVVGTCVRTLNLAGASLILKGQTNIFDIQASEGSLNDPDKKDKLLLLVYQRNARFEFPFSADPNNRDLAFFIPLKTWDNEIGFLCIGPKINRQVFSSDDIYLLQGLSVVAAAALRSAMLNRDVSLRDTFVSIASHELRTPLTSIIGYADLLLRKETTVETRKAWLKNILDNGQKITDMVDDLLNISRIQSGKITVKLSEINLSELISDRLTLYQESTNNHTFSINVAPGLPEVTADRDKTGQIIGNLLSNAIKYSPKGGNIIVSAVNEPSQKRVILSVQDEGLGISPQDQATLFKTFHRVQRPETRGIRGSGLGLYIVKEWAEAMGAKVWLHSELNKGSTFYVSFPIRQKSDPAL